MWRFKLDQRARQALNLDFHFAVNVLFLAKPCCLFFMFIGTDPQSQKLNVVLAEL